MPTDEDTNPSPLAATAQDAADILDLRNRLSDWMHNRGISQWRRSDVSEERIRHQAAAGQW